jgi:pimeloyl-ACP methyl ester carboxylesterase
MPKYRYGPDHPETTYVPHAYAESRVDLGEIAMNYAVAGDGASPALLLIPGQATSWWDYEQIMQALEADFRIFAVDLRGQGRSSRTPGRYTLDNMGNDLVRFIQSVVRRPTMVVGHSSGGVLAAWLAAYAPPGLVKAVYLEDAPLFSMQLAPACGHGIRQTAVGLLLALRCAYLGDQWSISDWRGMLEAAPSILPDWMHPWLPALEDPPQRLREYDPEWARACCEGTLSASCDHAQMLKSVKTPVLFSHHFRGVDADNRLLQGAISDLQVSYARKLVEGAGQRFDYRSFPEIGHAMHAEAPERYVELVRRWGMEPRG